ncbi:unnamed protein product, partial [Ilex paraguariensis]
DNKMHDEGRNSESLGRREEQPALMNKEGMVVVAAEPPVRAVRKRHHTLTHSDNTVTPLLRMPPFYPLSSQNITIFHMLQQFNNFES